MISRLTELANNSLPGPRPHFLKVLVVLAKASMKRSLLQSHWRSVVSLAIDGSKKGFNMVVEAVR